MKIIGMQTPYKYPPLTLLPITLTLLAIIAFVFFVPPGGDLTTAQGDELLGSRLVDLYIACSVIDCLRWYFASKKNSE